MTDAATTPPTKRCRGCGTDYPRSPEHFHVRPEVPDGFRARCRRCSNKYRRERASENVRLAQVARELAGEKVRRPAAPPAPIPAEPIGDDEVTDGRPVAPPASSRPAAEPREPEKILREHRLVADLDRSRRELKRLAHELHLAQERTRVLDAFARVAAPPVVRREVASGMREATAVVLCSDWHVEEPVEPEKVNGLNEYNLEIAAKRIDRMTEGTLWLLGMHRAKFQIRDLILWLGGDLMTGHIHDELVESALLHPVETVLWLQNHLIPMIDTIAASGGLERIIVPCSPGNHGRTTEKRRIQTNAENSYEWLLYQHLAMHYAGHPQVQIVAPKSQLIYLNVYDRVLRFTHGESVGFGGGVGGISIPLNKAIAGWNVAHRADVTCLGHFHQLTNLEHLVVNGSLIGHNPFAVAIRAPFEHPRQAFFLMDSRRGKCCNTPIWVDDRIDAERSARAV